MKTLFKTVIATIIVMLFLIAGMASAQDTTSVFELKLYNTQNKLVPGKNVDLYQGVTKKYDLTESASVPGVYSATVRHGEYDIYVGGSSWKAGIWIGSNKISLMADQWYFDGSTAILRADTLYGDGSNLTGIAGSVADAPDDLLLNADANEDRIGDIEFVLADTVRGAVKLSTVKNQTSLIIGRYVGSSISGVGAAGFDPVIQLQVDSTGTISVARVYGAGSGARYAFLQVDDFLNRIVSGSTETGNPPGSDLWPYDLIAGVQTAMRIDTLENTVIQGTANNRTAAAYTENIFQVQADTSVRSGLARIYGSGAGARIFNIEVDDLNDIMKIVSTKTGTVPGDSAFPMVFWVGSAGGNRVEIHEAQTKINNWLSVHDVFSLDTDTYDYNEVSFFSHSDQSSYPSWAFGSYKDDQVDYPEFGFYIWQYQKSNGDPGIGPALAINDAGQVGIGTAAAEDHVSKLTVEGEVTSWNPIELAGGAWFGGTRDTIASIIPAVSFSESGGDTVYYDLGMFSNAVRIDSVWLDVTTEDTAGDSSRCVLGHRLVDFGEAYGGAFTTQNSDYADMGAGNLRTKLRFTTEIALDANHRLVLKLYRDNSIGNNSAAPLKLAGAVVFGKGLR